MKKKIALVSLLLLAVLSPLMADKLVFTEVGVSFASIIMPRAFESNATGTYDTAAFDLKAGFDIFKWADIYVGGGFQFFADRPNPQGFDNYYTFYPVYGGIRANIFRTSAFIRTLFLNTERLLPTATYSSWRTRTR